MKDLTFSNNDVRKFYDSQISEKFDNEYEFRRWHKDPQDRSDYFTIHESIARRIIGVKFADYFELGPGPGTWTTLFYRANPNAAFTLVDISKEMSNQYSLEMRTLPNVEYIVSDLLDFKESKKIDLFFSSRALEYIEDKKAAIKKISELMRPGAQGYIITKNPERGLKRRVDSRPLHQGQISFKELKQLLSENGFSHIEAYPSVVRMPAGRLFPSWARTLFGEMLYRHYANKKFSESMSWLSRITESYIVTFVKS